MTVIAHQFSVCRKLFRVTVTGRRFNNQSTGNSADRNRKCNRCSSRNEMIRTDLCTKRRKAKMEQWYQSNIYIMKTTLRPAKHMQKIYN